MDHSFPIPDGPGPEVGGCYTDDAIRAFREDRLPDDEAERLADHAARCPACERKLTAFDAPPELRSAIAGPLPSLEHIDVASIVRKHTEGVYRFLGPPRPEFPDDLGTLGRFRVLARIGEGGHAVVFLGRDEDMG